MRIIPVVDVLGGVAVHAVRGERNEYKALQSILCRTSNPVDVAAAFEECGFSELYVADLDAILDKGNNQAILREIAKKTSLKLMVDAGVSCLSQARVLLDQRASKVIIGTETLGDLRFVERVIDRFGGEKIVVSLDLQAGEVVSKSKRISSMPPLQLARELVQMGLSELIVLDLARVGSGEGLDFALVKELVASSKVKLLAGGGVRDAVDLLTLKSLGVDGVLLATALHSGVVSACEVQRLAS